MAKKMWLMVGKEYLSLGLPLFLVPFLFTFLVLWVVLLFWFGYSSLFCFFFFSWVINRRLLKIWIGGKTLWFLEFKDIYIYICMYIYISYRKWWLFRYYHYWEWCWREIILNPPSLFSCSLPLYFNFE